MQRVARESAELTSAKAAVVDEMPREYFELSDGHELCVDVAGSMSGL